MEIKKILIIGSSEHSCMEQSYVRAAESLGVTVRLFDPSVVAEKYIRFGKIGKKIDTFLPVYAWERKMSRDLIVEVKEYRPDVVLLFTIARIQFGALATIKIISNAKIAWVWPDSPLNLVPQNILSRSMYDVSATYSEKSVPVFAQLGFNNVKWVPLAGDTLMHWCDSTPTQFDCDISFVGMWRPERERMLKAVMDNFPELRMEIYGSNWKRECKDKGLLKKLKGYSLRGKALADYFNRSMINLNVIDDTNYPAANMRFFEICTAGGLQVTTVCPEMEDKFRHKEHLLYAGDEAEMINSIKWILDNPAEADKIRRKGQELIAASHSYIVRLTAVLDEINKLG